MEAWRTIMNIYDLNVSTRQETGKRIKKRRKEGYIPAVIYGSGSKPMNLEMEYLQFSKIFKKAGETSLINLIIDKQSPVKVLVHDIQIEPLSQSYLHVDFYQVDMNKAITAEIPLKFSGQSEAVKSQGGTLVKNYSSVEVECLPDKLVSEIIVDISLLKTFDDVIKIKDIKAPDGIKILSSMDQSVVMVEPPRSEAEMAALEGKPEEDVAKVGLVEVKKDEEVAAEGTDAAKPTTEKKDKK